MWNGAIYELFYFHLWQIFYVNPEINDTLEQVHTWACLSQVCARA